MNLFRIITGHPDVVFQRAIYSHRKYRYAKDNMHFLGMLLWGKFANYYARKYNLELYGKYGSNLKISHGNIIINGNAELGNNVVLHGNNCIGNNSYMGKSPHIGDNVEIGYGAILIGDITVADNVIIGAGALVNKDILETGAVVVGNPGHIVNKRK